MMIERYNKQRCLLGEGLYIFDGIPYWVDILDRKIYIGEDIDLSIVEKYYNPSYNRDFDVFDFDGESSQKELSKAPDIQAVATTAAVYAEVIAKLLIDFREKYEGDTSGGDSASATNGEEAYIFTKILSRHDINYKLDESNYEYKIMISLLQIYIEKIVDKYDLGKVEESEGDGGNENTEMPTRSIITLPKIIGLGVENLLLNCMFDNKIKDYLELNEKQNDEELIGEANFKDMFLDKPLVFLISYQKTLNEIQEQKLYLSSEEYINVLKLKLKLNYKQQGYILEKEILEKNQLEKIKTEIKKETPNEELKEIFETYEKNFTNYIKLLIKSNGYLDKMYILLKQELYEYVLDKQILSQDHTKKVGGSYTDIAMAQGISPPAKFEEYIGVFQFLGDAIDTDDFDNDSKHDNLTTKNFSGENDAIKVAQLTGGGLLFNKLNENGRFIKVDMKTGISSETPLEGLESMNFLVDAGGGFFKGLPDKDPCSSTAAPTLTTKYISNYTDPASTGKGLLYRCFNEIGGVGANAAINGANIFIKYCIEFTGKIIEKSKIGELEYTFYADALNFLGGVTVEAITGDKFNCNYVDKMSQNHGFYWLGNQSVMANWINAAYGRDIAAPRSSVTGGYNDINHAYKQFLTDNGKVISEKHVYALCRILKYMGDKSHIVAAVLMIKLKEQPFIIQTIDRLLAKCVVQVIEYCRTNPAYQFISQNLGVMLTNARKAPVITHTLACYNDVSGDNECKGTESAIFTYYTSNTVAINIKWIDTFLESYENTMRSPFPSFPFLQDYKLKSDETSIQSIITNIKSRKEYTDYTSSLVKIKLQERIEKIKKLSTILPLKFSEGRSGIRLQNGPVVKAHYFTQLSKFNELLSLTLETINEKKDGGIGGEIEAVKNKAANFKTTYDVIYNLVVADPIKRGNYNMIDDPTTLQLQIFQNVLGYGRGRQQLPIQVYTEHPGLSGLASSSAKKYAGQVAKSYVDELTSIYELCCKLEPVLLAPTGPAAAAGPADIMEE